MGVLICPSLVTPKFSVPPSGEIMRQTPNVLEVQERARGSLSPCQPLVGLGFHPPPKVAKKVEVFRLSVTLCLSVTLLNVRVCSPDFAMKALGVQK